MGYQVRDGIRWEDPDEPLAASKMDPGFGPQNREFDPAGEAMR